MRANIQDKKVQVRTAEKQAPRDSRASDKRLLRPHNSRLPLQDEMHFDGVPQLTLVLDVARSEVDRSPSLVERRSSLGTQPARRSSSRNRRSGSSRPSRSTRPVGSTLSSFCTLKCVGIVASQSDLREEPLVVPFSSSSRPRLRSQRSSRSSFIPSIRLPTPGVDHVDVEIDVVLFAVASLRSKRAAVLEQGSPLGGRRLITPRVGRGDGLQGRFDNNLTTSRPIFRLKMTDTSVRGWGDFSRRKPRNRRIADRSPTRRQYLQVPPLALRSYLILVPKLRLGDKSYSPRLAGGSPFVSSAAAEQRKLNPRQAGG